MVRSRFSSRLTITGALFIRSSIALGALGALSPGEAWAQEPASDEPSAADKETARTLFREGDEKFRAGDFEGAFKAFRAADEIMGVPTTGLEHARSLMMLGRLLEARDLFIKVSNRETRADELPAQQTARDEARDLADKLASRIPAIKVVVVNAPAGAEVKLRIDDIEIPPSAVEFPRKVDPGDHTVKAYVAGYKPVSRKISVAEQEEKVVELTLEASDEDASLVDPWGGDKAPSRRGAPIMPTLSWIGFSVGVVGLGIAIPSGVFAVSEKGSLEDSCNGNVCPRALEGDLDTAVAVAHVSTAGFVLAGVGIAVGVTGFFIRDSLPDALAEGDAPVTLRPYVGVGAAGFTGTF